MTQARSKQVSLQDTRYYHLFSRCVHRAYLCAEDSHTKQSYEHRKLTAKINRTYMDAPVMSTQPCSFHAAQQLEVLFLSCSSSSNL